MSESMTRDKKIWTAQEDATLRRLCDEKFTYGDISLKMNRTSDGVKARVKRLNISHPLYRVKGLIKVVMAKQFVSEHPETYILYGNPPKTMADVGKNECRWMVDKLCCADVCTDKYCETHLRLSRGRE